EVGDFIEIERDGLVLRGILMPSYSQNSDKIIVVKLDNGYNVGISIYNIKKINLIKKRTQQQVISKEIKEQRSQVKIISTGGTIVSKIEYETGAVRPALTTDEIISFMPEIRELGEVSAEVLFSILSENMKPEYWIKIANAVKKAFDEGNEGVVVAHGTDTMSYTAAALAFSLKKLQGPVVLVGSQRSSDRPSSDSAINLYTAILTAKEAPFGEVVINMHGESSDTYTLVHRGVKVRKMHTSRRDAFQSINDIPLAKVLWDKKQIKILRSDYIPKKDETEVDAKFDDRVFLLYYYPGMKSDIIEYLASKYRGVIIAGTGLGHVSQDLVSSLEKAIKDGVFIGMTSQCLFGRVNMNVYTTGRILLKAGVVPLEDMLPEVALVKLMWGLAHYSDHEELKSFMLRNIVGEINYVHKIEHYPRWYHGD
ncbi:MAG: Glu-tRNA(Gln) amidotransferase subunit GatD, partial [Sulfolobaceae archaeon]